MAALIQHMYYDILHPSETINVHLKHLQNIYSN